MSSSSMTSLPSTNNNSLDDKIPILKRRAAAIAFKSSSNTTMTMTNGSSCRSKSSSSMAQPSKKEKEPIVIIVVGMAGSGKTTLMAQLTKKSLQKRNNNIAATAAAATKKNNNNNNTTTIDDNDGEEGGCCGCYSINLDPATKHLPYHPSIDIRDTINYIQVMKQHQLGPNGAILTCLNLFATKFDQVMEILEKRCCTSTTPPPTTTTTTATISVEERDENISGGENDNNNNTTTTNEGSGATKKTEDSTKASSATSTTTNHTIRDNHNNIDYILMDTPGQIEAFTWSASGSIITTSLASTFPTVLAYVIDTPRCAASVHTFMSNMLYACSMLYRAKLPMIIVLNKVDVVGCEFVKEWMEEYDSFQEALDDATTTSSGDGGLYSEEEERRMGGGSGYYASLTRSLSLVLDEFYNHLHKVGVSAATGEGVDEFWKVVQVAAEEYESGYLVDLKLRVEERMARENAMIRANERRYMLDKRMEEEKRKK